MIQHKNNPSVSWATSLSVKKKTYMIISVDIERAFDMIQHLLIV